MKLFRFLPLLGLFVTIEVAAQTFTDDLAAKRANLIYNLRDIGPLAPNNWVNSGALWTVNGASNLTDYSYHFMGNYGLVGEVGSEYFYGYKNSGVWSYSNPDRANTGIRFDDFGLHEQSLSPYLTNYHFSMESANYNIAGLKCLSIFVVVGIASGNYSGYIVSPGDSFFTGLVYSDSRTFDLGQSVETPTFRVANYHFGLYPNFPADPNVYTPQDTQGQTQGARLAGGVGTSQLLIAWVQEGVYRPSFALQPGYSSPRLYTYMQQYFDGAWKCDPVTGNPVRLTTTNWNGIGKINTNTTASTGSINPQGGFIPTQSGKQIIKTRPLENGFYGELPFYALQMFVDKNRDGILNTNDVTTASNPHVFWVNNDCDRAVYTDDDLWDELDLDVATNITDSAFVQNVFRIPTLRDLEDYDRLHIRGLNELARDLPTGQGYTISMRWKTVLSGNPGIFVFRAADTNGSQSYLTSQTTAATQLAPGTYPPTGFPGPSPLYIGWVASGSTPQVYSDLYRNTNECYIYCGTSRGAGELAVTVYKGSQIIGETSLYLDLRDVKELYERWTLGDGNGGEPATNAVLVTSGLPSGVSATQFNDNPATPQPYILFVHGWNMDPWEKDSFAETSFKRLYWQGYTNRFGSLRWPTTYGFSGSIVDIVTDPHNYDNGEFTAWRSGEGLRRHLVNLNQRYPGKTYVLAHSMGNVVAGEALALNAEKYSGGQIVNRYVASQAAVPIHCYSQNAPAGNFLNFQYTPTIFQITYPFANWDSGTGNVYPGWLSTNRASCAERVNFYNPNDFALAKDAWQFNQALKPDSGFTFSYLYLRFNSPQLPNLSGSIGSIPSHIIPSLARKGISPPLFRQLPGAFLYSGLLSSRFLDFEYDANAMYEVMAYASETRTLPLGALGETGVMERKFNLWDAWLGDPDPNNGNGIYARHKWHSAQFRSNYTTQNIYWANLLGKNGFVIFLDR